MGFEKLTSFFSRATARPADIVVDANAIKGPLPQTWRFIAQGGEEGKRTFMNVRDELLELSPRYVRIDHIYDQYNIVSRKNGQLLFDWSELDQTVRDILSSGAAPFFALSYMPADLSSDGTIIGKPQDWKEWQILIQKTIERYSGKSNMGIENVYYEVWNEPDLFGGWKMYGEKNYLDLYYFAADGAKQAEDTEKFFFGGPGTTAPYKNWIIGLVEFAKKKNLPLDFISWHRYSTDLLEFRNDYNKVIDWLNNYPDYQNLPKIISEFGYDSENNSAHDTNISAAHAVAVLREIIPEVEMAASFELKDGLSPSGEKFWGRWGVLTHDQFENEKKPRFYALKLLNNLSGRRLAVSGEGSFVKAIGASDFGKVKIILVNYDKQNSHAETVPVKITNLSAVQYQLTQQDINQNQTENTLQAVNGEITYQAIMPPNSVILITLSPID